MAERLIDSLSTDFEPAAYRDEYREQLLALIERKAEGKEIVAAEAEAPRATKTPDLMAALEQSIAAVQGGKPGGAKAKSKSSSSRKKAAGKAKRSASKSSSDGSGPSKKRSSRAKSKSK